MHRSLRALLTASPLTLKRQRICWDDPSRSSDPPLRCRLPPNQRYLFLWLAYVGELPGLHRQVTKQPTARLHREDVAGPSRRAWKRGWSIILCTWMPFFSTSTKARWCASSQVNSAVFFSCMAQTAGPKPDSRPVGAPAAINVRWKAHLLKWNFALAVRNHLRTRRSWLRRRAFQSCHFARQSWAAFTQTALYPAGSTLSAHWAYSPLFIHSFPPGLALPLWRMGDGAAQLLSPDRVTLRT